MKKLLLIGLAIFLAVALNGISVAADEAKAENEVVVVDAQEDQTGTKVAAMDGDTLQVVTVPETQNPACVGFPTKCCQGSSYKPNAPKDCDPFIAENCPCN